MVVLAASEKLGYGRSFEEALNSLAGDVARAPVPEKIDETKDAEPSKAPGPAASPTPVANLQQLINRAVQEFEEYQRLTSQGKLGEAGQKLEQHKRTLEELKKTSTRP
jgi:hypothetical protein